MKNLIYLCLVVCVCAGFCVGDELPFSVDVLSLSYSDDAGRNIDYDFTDGQVLDPGRIAIPASAVLGQAAGEPDVTFLWESPLNNGGALELLTLQELSRQSIPHWHYSPTADPNEGVENYVSLGAYNAAQVSPQNWTYTIRVSNFQHQDGLGLLDFREYGVSAGLGSSSSLAECYLKFEWFTGWAEGEYVEDVLVLMADVEDYVNNDWWESEPVIVFDQDRLTTEVELKLQISNGTMFSAYYRLDNETIWQPVCEDYETPYAIPGFPALFPHLSMSNEVTWHHIAKFEMEELARLASWWLDSTCSRDVNDGCYGMDINEDGSVDSFDLLILADHWTTRL